MTDTEDLIQRILGADRETVYEAAQLYAATLEPEFDGELPDHPLLREPADHPGDVEDLARVLLLVAVESDPAEVALALDGAGRRQVVLGGAELVALAALGVGALHVLVSRGRTREVRTRQVREGADGEREVVETIETTYGISGQLGSLLRGILGSGD
jgi:hypothetical protein